MSKERFTTPIPACLNKLFTNRANGKTKGAVVTVPVIVATAEAKVKSDTAVATV